MKPLSLAQQLGVPQYWTYREAAEKLAFGDLGASFPPGSFPPPSRFVLPHPATGFG